MARTRELKLSDAARMLALLCLAVAAAALPTTTTMPSESCPFIFFHQRKTGGSSLRQALMNASLSHNLRAYIPCMTGACSGLPQRDWSHRVLAGHLPWSYAINDRPAWMLKPKISCLTIFRHPLQRVRSCHYYSFSLGSLKFSDMSPGEMKAMLTKTNVGELCTNEPVRIFSGFTVDHLVANLCRYPGLSEQLIALSRENLRQCVILMQDDLRKPITAAILNHWFPWLNHTIPNANINIHKPPEEHLSPAQSGVLREVLGAEYSLWHEAKDQYNAQVALLKQIGKLPQ